MGNTHVYKARVKRWRAKLDKYEEKYRMFVQKKLKVYVKLAEAQALLYNQVAVFFLRLMHLASKGMNFLSL